MATDSRLLEMTPSSRLRVSVLLLNGDLLVLSLAPSNFESRGVASLSRRSSIFLPHPFTDEGRRGLTYTTSGVIPSLNQDNICASCTLLASKTFSRRMFCI